ncbi:MAG TPA: nuclear transport factor 2 family protein [Solirubrobacterales bacterium]|jgi:ketosteroid isomerase-like protein|nr:nuclear transport factor 2 family protein [Solirubrobacterales bacterium]
MSIPADDLIERLRDAYERFNAEDFDAAIEMAHPDIVFARPGGQSELRGVDALRAWMEPDAFESQVMRPEEFEAAGSRVLVRQRATARGAVSGIEVEIDSWTLWTFDDDGRATRMEFFLNHQEDEARRALHAD